MPKTVSRNSSGRPYRTAIQFSAPKDVDQVDLPDVVADALGQHLGAAREGLLALSASVGLSVLEQMLEAEMTSIAGPKGKHNPNREAIRNGHDEKKSAVTLGGRRVPVRRPRARRTQGKEIQLATYKYFAARDRLEEVVMERMLAGVSSRRFARVQEPVGYELEVASRSTSKSSVSRMFVERTRYALSELMTRRLDDVRLAVLMIDGIFLRGRTNVVALGITTSGNKICLGLWDGATENAAVATSLLSDLVSRGLDTSQGVLCVVDGSKALRRAISDVLGHKTPVQRCVRHKERNVIDHLPKSKQATATKRLRAAWAETDYQRAKAKLERFAKELETSYPGASASLREGLEETLTITRLGIEGSLKRTLESTNPIESLMSSIRRSTARVKRWRSGEMALRWTAVSMLDAEDYFHRVDGYRQLAELANAVEREVAAEPQPIVVKQRPVKGSFKPNYQSVKELVSV